ncbi:hypothetical protein [Pelotalea chapellei]|uniref:Uncharacterized protein n=1 Tax=Pelotalea chapellei TaxID=44671 RepID=A0ABS5UD75_9BACT|nr:hypothetical protein [Pelotalea chapellei]MBT1073441.1 hypothetical protein [Pelotalea chapellei]
MHKRKLPLKGFNLKRWEWSTVIGIVTLACTIYLVNLEPNLKYSSFNYNDKLIGRKIDSKNNFLYHFSITPRFKNASFKTGYVDKVEFVPVSIETIPDVKVISIRKAPIPWRSVEDVEIQFIVTVPTDFDAKLKEKKVSTELIVNAYDNTGKKIERSTDGRFIRGYLNLWGTIVRN